ncbi:MAG: hypothetical protein ACOCZD_00085 [Haloferacaceae archaeon]
MSSQAGSSNDSGGANVDTFAVGDTVVDRQDDDPNTATVINCPPVTCAEWDVGDETVADHNPEYDPEADVVVVAFDEDLDEARPDYDGSEPLPLAEIDLPTYAFPPGRLALLDTERGAAAKENQTDPSRSPLDGFDDLRELKERLEENADVDVRCDSGEPVLTLTKAAREYRIRPDGSVSDGPFQTMLADVAAEYVGGES